MHKRYVRQQPERLWWVEPVTWWLWSLGVAFSALWWACAEQTPADAWELAAIISLVCAVTFLCLGLISLWFDWIDR